ncbi:MAG: hypothetical protein IKP47_03185 [Ruminococcus sp.]|nr:hypothetical protein [Ruminococcus sp.]
MIFVIGAVRNSNDAVILTGSANPFLLKMTKKDIVIFFASMELLRDKSFPAFLDRLPYTSIILDLDEGFYQIADSFKVTKRFGSRAYIYSDSAYVIADSGMYTIKNYKIMMTSIGFSEAKYDLKYNARSDIQRRRFRNAFERYGMKADYVISNTAPHKIFKKMQMSGTFDYNGIFLDRFLRRAEFKSWFFAYPHRERIVDEKFFCKSHLFTPLNVLELDTGEPEPTDHIEPFSYYLRYFG